MEKENEKKMWEKHLGKKVASEKLVIEGFDNPIPFDIYDGHAVCEDFKDHRYDMEYPQMKIIRDSKEMSEKIVEKMNLRGAEEITVLHVLITFNTLYVDGVEVTSKGE